MALAETTLSSAVALTDKSIVVASATSVVAGRLLQVGGEVMQVTKDYSSGTTLYVLRGQNGTAQYAHPASTRVVHGDAADFASNSIGQATTYPIVGRTRNVVNYSATGTMVLPKPGEDLLVVLNGTAITLTIPVPTLDLDGCMLYFVNSAGAAHVLTFTGGLGGASTSYDVLTLNATGTVAFSAIACNQVWCGMCGIPVAGTVTNVTATLA